MSSNAESLASTRGTLEVELFSNSRMKPIRSDDEVASDTRTRAKLDPGLRSIVSNGLGSLAQKLDLDLPRSRQQRFVEHGAANPKSRTREVPGGDEIRIDSVTVCNPAERMPADGIDAQGMESRDCGGHQAFTTGFVDDALTRLDDGCIQTAKFSFNRCTESCWPTAHNDDLHRALQ